MLCIIVPRARTGVFPGTPATLLAWHRKLYGGKYDTTSASSAPKTRATKSQLKQPLLEF